MTNRMGLRESVVLSLTIAMLGVGSSRAGAQNPVMPLSKAVLYARTSSRAITQRFSTLDGRVIRLHLGESGGLAYYFAPGGLPIVVEDQLIGAIGVGGGAQEEQCAHHALTKVLGPQPPLSTAAPATGAQPASGGRGGAQ